MPNFTNSERIAFNEDLDRYQAQEVAADKRNEWVEKQVEYLLKDEYNPFTPEHVQESISELSFADAILLGSYVKAAFDLKDNNSAQVNLADFVTDRVQDYWHSCAVKKAQDDYDKDRF